MVVRVALESSLEWWKSRTVVGDNGCVLWVGAIQSNGYGHFRIDKSFVKAHRFAYETFRGPIPSGLCIDHLCRVRRCVNPNHLEAVTHKVNTLRGDTVTAKNAQKTRCNYGHEYTAENTIVRSDGGRRCRACNISYHREYNKMYKKELV